MEYDMKPNEAKTRSMEARKRLVKEQLGNVRALIEEAAGEGKFSLSEHQNRLQSTRGIGWLDEVVETLKEEGYIVDFREGWIEVSWEKALPLTEDEVPKFPSMLIKEGTKIKGAFDIPPRPYKDPHILKEDGGGILAMVLTGLVISGLILLGLMWG